jgi:hypothetical protein
MSLGKYRILVLAVFLSLVITSLLFAGTTGKIAGRITDKETGEPLIGVNVTVKGTSLGAATDVDGYYAILYVPPGVQTVVASMVGYAPVTVEEVRVLIDQTAPLDVPMVSQAIETGAVEIVAERNVVKKDVSTSVSAVRPEEIQSLPVSTIDEVVGLQAGVENGMVIRGGEADQLLLQIDGVTMRDPRNNKPISTVALSSIQEVSIERGGFNAEYGQVRSGIINIVEKEADIAHYTGTIEVKYVPPQQKYFGMSVYDPYSMWNRPYMDPAVCWTGTDNGNWDKYTQAQYPTFQGGWNAMSQSLLSDSDPTNDLTPAELQRIYEWQHRRTPDTKAPDYTVDGSIGGPVPIIGEKLGNLRFFTSYILNREMLLIPLSREDYKDYKWSLKLNSDITKKMKLTLSASTGKSYNVPINATDNGYYNQVYLGGGAPFWGPTDFVRTPDQVAAITYEARSARIYTDSWYSEADVSDYSLAGKLSSFISASTFYEISVENIHRNYLTGPIRTRDTSRIYEVVPGYFVDEAPFGYSTDLSSGIGDPTLFFGGHSATARDSSKLNSFTLKADLTSQVNKEHLIKTGIEFAYYDLKLDYGTYNPHFMDVNWVDARWNPYRLSAYVQDKIEAYGFIANIGLRLDLSNPNTDWVQVDPFSSFFSPSYSDTINYPKTRVKPDIALSPRLGISHPITETSKLFFNYGHFKEMPAYEEVFRIGRGAAGKMQNYGDPSMVQAKTISYELGFDQSLFDTYLIQIAAFYNDISQQQALTFYASDQKNIGYYMATNNGYSDIRGFELTLRKSSGNWVRGFINYTYQVVTYGAFGKTQIDESITNQIALDQNTSLLYQQKPVPQPRANASIMFLLPSDFGPKILGIKPLSDWSLNVLAMWKAGEWLTYNPNNLANVVNNVQVTDYYNIDLRLNKTFDFKTFSVTLFMQVRNLLNTKRLSGESFYDPTDYLAYMGSLHLPQSIAYSNDNIPGDDRVGTYREDNVKYQPVFLSGDVNGINTSAASFDPSVIYYDKRTGLYKNFNVTTHEWEEVDHARMQKILDDKAYIDMPNNSSFDFLNPRQFSYGINLSFKI